MVKRAVRRISGLAFAVVAAQSCGDANGPGLSERYQLELYEGAPLPAVAFEGGGVSSTVLGAEVLLLRGKGRMTTTIRGVDSASPRGRIETQESAFTYTLDGVGISIYYVCPANADCIAGPHLIGQRIADRLMLARPTSSKSASIYRRTR